MTCNKNAVEHSRELLLAGEFMTTMPSINKAKALIYDLWIESCQFIQKCRVQAWMFDASLTTALVTCCLLVSRFLLIIFSPQVLRETFLINFYKKCIERHSTTRKQQSEVREWCRVFSEICLNPKAAHHTWHCLSLAPNHIFMLMFHVSLRIDTPPENQRETNKSENYMLQSKNSQMITGFPGIS